MFFNWVKKSNLEWKINVDAEKIYNSSDIGVIKIT